MNEQTQSPSKESKPWPLYIIFGMVAFVLISGYLLSPKTEEGKLAWVSLLGTTNRGVLLNPPIEVAESEIVNESGEPWSALKDNTWKLLVVNPGACEQVCVDRLKELHAMRIRLNRDADRLTIGLLSSQNQRLPADVAQFHDMNIMQFSNPDLLLKLKETNMPSLDAAPVVLLMNPIDIFMMAYGSEHTGSEMLEDFEYLLDMAH